MSSPLEDQLAWQIRIAGLPTPIRQFIFHPIRQWKSDFVWPKYNLICEVEGGVYIKGRHTRGVGFENDCEKYNNATILGYRVLRVTARHIQSGEALQWISEILDNV